MKKILYTILLISIFSQVLIGQCNTNVSICTPGVAGPFPFDGNAPGPPTDYANPVGCATGTFGNVTDFGFIMLNITTSGPLNLLVDGDATSGFIDVVVYNVPSGVDPCVAVMNSGNEIACNYAPGNVGCTQFGNSFPCASSVAAPNVTAGDLLMIIVHDYSNQSNNFTLQLGATGAQTGPPDATITPVGTQSSTGPPIVMTAADGGGTWSASCGACIDATTGQFNPATAGPGNHTICYSIGTAPCSDDDCVVVTVTTPCNMTASTNSSNVTCSGAANGTASANQANGTAPFSYAWTPGGAGAAINGLAPGTYNVVVTDNLGCTATAAATITQPTVLNVNTAGTNESCIGNDGSVAANASGGTAPYSYSWSHNGGLNNANATGLTAGSYTVTVTDNNGCTAQSVSTIVQTGLITAGFTYNGNQCLVGNNFAFTNTGTAGQTYSWTFDDGGTSTAQNPAHPYAAAGTYTVTQNVSNGTCTETSTVNIVVYPMPTLNAVGIDPDCNGNATGSIDLTISGGTPAYGISWSSGPITEDLSNITSGTYTATISDNNGCQATTTVTLTDPVVLANSVAPTDASCAGVCDGSAITSPTGGTAPFSYVWSTGGTAASETGMCDGTASVIITDVNGCTVTTNTTIGIATVLASTNSSTLAGCGLSNGSATLNVTGATGPINYTWTPLGGTGATAAAIPAGAYSVTATDANGCIITDNVTVSNTAGPTANITASTNISCVGGSDGTATVTASGGTAPYSYVWSPVGGTADIGTGMSANVQYTVTITDNNNCVATADVTLTEPTAIAITTSTTGSNCAQNDGSATANPSGGTGPYTYSWSDGSTVVGTNATANNIFAGAYTVTVTDANMCTQVANVSVTDQAAGSIAVTSTDISCNGVCDGAAVAAVTGGTAPINYLWNNAANTAVANATALCQGTYSVTATDAVGCVLSATITINEPAVLTAAISANADVTCFSYTDGSATVTSTGGSVPYSYLWNDASAQTTATALGLAPGGYVVSVTDNNGCQALTNVTINEPVDIQLGGADVDAHCNSADGQATVSVLNGGVGPFTYSWSGNPSTTLTASNVAPGIITATVTDANTCVQTIDITVGDIPAGVVNITNVVNPLCSGDCNGSATVSMSGTGTAPYTYLWNDPAAQSTVSASGLCDGNVTVQATDANGCVSLGNVTLVEPVVLAVQIAQSHPLCFEACDGNLQAQVVGGTAPYAYQWDDPLMQVSLNAGGLCGDGTVYTVAVTDANGCTVTKGGFLVDPPELLMDSVVTNSNCGLADGDGCVSLSGGTGIYNVVWQYNGSTNLCESGLAANTYIVDGFDANGCNAQISVTVSDLSGPTATITSQTDVTCFAGADGSGTALITGGVQPYDYLWDGNAGNQITPTASNLSLGTYSLTITDASGCAASTSVTIIQPDSIQINGAMIDPTCFGYTDGQITASAIGGDGNFSFSWNDPANQTNNVASGLPIGNYIVTVVDGNGCSNFNQFSLFEPAELNGIMNFTDVQCNAACNGTATITFVNGAAPVTFLWDDPSAQTTSTATGLCVGNYSVILTDNSGCFDSVSVAIAEPTVLTSQLDNSGNVTCSGFCDGFATVAAAGGTGPYSYSWTNGAITPTIANICAGNYTCTVTDAQGCISTTSVQITQPVSLTGVTSFIDVTCYGQQNGTAGIVASGGTLPYVYQWDDLNFQTTSVASGLFAGTYNISVIDAQGCTIDQVVIVGQPTQVSGNVTPVSTNCGQNNGQACIGVSGGTVPYAYAWNDPNAQTTACALGISAGTYTVTVTDGNNCVYDTIININDIAAPAITLNGSIDPSCFGLADGSVDMTVTGGVAPYMSQQWVDAASNPVGLPNTSVINLIGDDCYTLQVTDGAGCISALTECINEPNPLNSAILTSQDVTCYLACNGEANLGINGGTVPYATAWSNGDNTTGVIGLCAGTYQANVIDANGCTTSSSVTITEPAQLLSNIATFQNTSCDGSCDGSIQIGINGGITPYFNSWTPNVSSTTMANSLCAGGYNIVTTDANGCTTSSSATVNSPPPLAGNFTVVDATCGLCNGSITFNLTGGTAPYSYLWDDGQTTQTANNVCAGVFEGVATDANGCTFTLVHNMMNIPGPQINNINWTQPSCFGVSNGTASPDITGGTAPFTFNWPSSGQNVQNAVGLAAGTHCVTVTDANGCIITDCATITEPASLVAIPDGSTFICYGDSTQIWANGLGGTLPYTINWTGANITGFIGQGPIFVNPTQSDDFCFRITDANGCLSSLECVDITVTPPLSVVLPADQFICDGADFDIIGMYSGGDGSPYVYDWTEVTYPGASVATTANLNVSPTGPTWYFVQLTDGCSTPAVDSILIDLNPNPVAFMNIVNPTSCAPGSIDFIANSDIGVSYEWDFECDGTTDIVSAGNVANNYYTTPGVYDICVNVISAAGCSTMVTEPAGVQIFANPVADFEYTPLQTTITDPYIYTSDSTGGISSWYWDFDNDGTIDDSTGSNSTYEYLYAGEYTVGLTVVNANGCTDSTTISYTVLPDQNIFVPNAFSPDGDGQNDFFYVKGIGLNLEEFDLFVFNRWGEIIWEGHSPDDQWDGRVNNIIQQQDVYVWKLITVDIEGTSIEVHGHVTLIK
jgi:gliding motility-associated-like protein